MSGMMTSRERVLAAMRREPVDYVPCCGHFNPLTPHQRRGRTWNFPWPEHAGQEEQVAYQVEQLGLDALARSGLELSRQAPDVLSDVWQEGDVLHKRYKTPAGDLCASIRLTDEWPGGMDIRLYSDFNVGHFVEPWFKEMRDLECLRHLLVPLSLDEAIAANRERAAGCMAFAEKHNLATLAHVGSGLTSAQHLFGVEGICLAVVDKPDLVDAYLEHEHRINLTGIEAAGALGFDIVRRNGFYETADFYGPATLERFLKARLQAEVAAAHRCGMLADYTVHTGVMPILDYLAALDFDSFFGMDMFFRGVDMGRVRDKLSPSKALWTGPSSTFQLWKGPEETRQAVRDVFECFGEVGLILTQCVSTHSIMPWESTLAMIDEWKKLR